MFGVVNKRLPRDHLLPSLVYEPPSSLIAPLFGCHTGCSPFGFLRTRINDNEYQERDTANEKLASTSALLETSKKNLADAEARCRALEEAAGGEEEKEAAAAAARRDAEARAASTEEKLSAAEQEKAQLLQQVCVCVCGRVCVCFFFFFFWNGCERRLANGKISVLSGQNNW